MNSRNLNISNIVYVKARCNINTERGEIRVKRAPGPGPKIWPRPIPTLECIVNIKTIMNELLVVRDNVEIGNSLYDKEGGIGTDAEGA